MNDVSITQNPNLDVQSLFNNAKGYNKETESATLKTPPPVAVVNKTPLQMMMEQQNSGLPIVNNNDDGPKRGGSMTDERIESTTKTIDDMTELAEKAKLVGITKKPTSDIEMAELIHELDKLDINELRAANERSANTNNENIIKPDDVIGNDISQDTTVSNDNGEISLGGNGLFVSKSSVDNKRVNKTINESSGNVVIDDKSDNSVSVLIEKEAIKEGDKSVIEFTDEEREKLKASKQIELITVNKININTGKVTRPDENFMKDYTVNMHKAIGTSATMTFVASRFRAQMRGLTFGEYVDLALSTEITNVDVLNKKLSVFYNAILNSSVGPFISYDEFLKNFAYKDVTLGTYCLYIATNPEVLELGLECGVDSCKKKFSVGFNPRNLLIIDSLSPRFLEIMETTGNLNGREAIDFHKESSIITKQVIELPSSELGIEIGLRSCFDMLNIVLPFINVVEDLMKTKYPDDINKVREIITYVTNYISAVYFKDANGEYTIRDDSIENIVDIIYNLPIADYEIISAIMDQTDEDYAYTFGVQNVICPGCGNETKVVSIDIDNEVFQRFQELGSTRIDKKSLPRL